MQSVGDILKAKYLTAGKAKDNVSNTVNINGVVKMDANAVGGLAVLATVVGVLAIFFPFRAFAEISDIVLTPDRDNYNEAEIVNIAFEEDGDACSSSATSVQYGTYQSEDSFELLNIYSDDDPISSGSHDYTMTMQELVNTGGNFPPGIFETANTYPIADYYNGGGSPCQRQNIGTGWQDWTVNEFFLDDFTQEYEGNFATFHATLPDIDYSGHTSVWMRICSTELDGCWDSNHWVPDGNWTDPWDYQWEESLPDGCYDSAEIFIGDSYYFNKQYLPGFEPVCLPYAGPLQAASTTPDIIGATTSVAISTVAVFFCSLVLCLWIYKTLA